MKHAGLSSNILGSRRLAFAAVLAGVLVSTAFAKADTVVVYNNLTTSSGFFYAGGGATDGSAATNVIADDINVGALAGTPINSFTFTIASGLTSNVTVSPEIIFYSDNGSGAPGAVLAGLLFNPVPVTGGQVASFSFSSSSTLLDAPSGTFWIGEIFTNLNGATATATQLNSIGVGIFGPPSVGTSNDLFFQGSTNQTGSNPTGSLQFFGGNPPADFGFELQDNTPTPPPAVPEPSSLILLGTGAFGLMGAARRKFRNA